MRLIWAAGRKSDSARRMRAQGVDRRVAQPHRGCCKGFPGWEGMSGRWSDQKRWGKPAAVGAPGSCNGRGVIRARVRLRAAPLWWKSGVCPKTAPRKAIGSSSCLRTSTRTVHLPVMSDVVLVPYSYCGTRSPLHDCSLRVPERPLDHHRAFVRVLVQFTYL